VGAHERQVRENEESKAAEARPGAAQSFDPTLAEIDALGAVEAAHGDRGGFGVDGRNPDAGHGFDSGSPY
jgi:hypothetical protein